MGQGAGSLIEAAGLVGKHDRDAVAYRIGKPGFAADELLRRAVVLEGALGQRTDQDLEKFGIDVGGVRRGVAHGRSRSLFLLARGVVAGFEYTDLQQGEKG